MNEAAGEGHDALCDLCSYYKPTEGKTTTSLQQPRNCPRNTHTQTRFYVAQTLYYVADRIFS